MKRLFIVDYRENGLAKHQCLEFIGIGPITDAAIITACHSYIGMHNSLDGVIEVLTDMSANELEKIVLTPEVLYLATRNLYINVEEVKRCVEILKEAQHEEIIS